MKLSVYSFFFVNTFSPHRVLIRGSVYMSGKSNMRSAFCLDATRSWNSVLLNQRRTLTKMQITVMKKC
jgi:hypothetical protein